MNIEEIDNNIRSLSDADLIDMLVNKEEYTKEALSVAEQEISKRKINKDIYLDIYSKLDAERKEREQKAAEDLTIREKILLLFFPFTPVLIFPMRLKLLPIMPSSRFFHEQGYKRKSSKVIWYKILSYVLWLVLVIGYLEVDNYIKIQRYQEYIKQNSANQTLNTDSLKLAG